VASPDVYGTAAVTVTNPYVPVNTAIIRFNNNGGTGAMADIPVELGSTLTTDELPVTQFQRAGHIQIGWRLNSPTGGFFPMNYAGVDFLVQGDITFYADWVQL
jgi:hypothetical protein